jgi:hypothetical protein
VDITRIDPSLRAETGPLLRMAARSHFKGEQYGNGAWGDVTIFDFSPNANLQVGDLPARPQNLLYGLALVVRGRARSAHGRDPRHVYWPCCAALVAEYKAALRFPRRSHAARGRELRVRIRRMLTGLVEMLRALSVKR